MGKVITLQQYSIKPELLYGADDNLLRKCVEDNMMSQFKRAIGELKWEDITDIEEETTGIKYTIRMVIKTGKNEEDN